jgi:hypothetical protein
MPRPRRRSPPLRHYRPKLRLDDRIGCLRTAQLFGAHSVTGDDAGLAAGLLAAGRSNRLVIVPAVREGGQLVQVFRQPRAPPPGHGQGRSRFIGVWAYEQRLLPLKVRAFVDWATPRVKLARPNARPADSTALSQTATYGEPPTQDGCRIMPRSTPDLRPVRGVGTLVSRT